MKDRVVFNQHEEEVKCMGVDSKVLMKVKGVIFFEKFKN